MRTWAADPTDLGKMTIEVLDENNKILSGDWYLHQGSTDKGMVLRNGAKGEVFNFPAGIYFLEVRNLKTHPFYTIFTENPQTLSVGGTVKFKVQYFKTVEQKERIQDVPAPVEPVVIEATPTPAVVTPAPVAPTRAPVRLNIVRPAVEEQPWISDAEATENNEYSLAVTGPGGVFGTLSILSLMAGFWITKRKNA